MEFRYFSAVEGRRCPRFGKGEAMIGCRTQIERDEDGTVTSRKLVWDVDKVVAIPSIEVQGQLKSYNNALRRGDLVERAREDHEAQLGAAPPPDLDEPPVEASEAPAGAEGDERPTEIPGEDLDGTRPKGAGKGVGRKGRSRRSGK